MRAPHKARLTHAHISTDIEDNSTHRRGKPCIHLTYGVDVAINAGNSMSKKNCAFFYVYSFSAMYFLPLLALKEKRNKFSDQGKFIPAEITFANRSLQF